MSLFEKYFNRSLDEQNIAGPGGAFGGELQGGQGQGGSVGNSDWYAPGDARTPHSVFSGHTKSKKKKKGLKEKKRTKLIIRPRQGLLFMPHGRSTM